MEMIRLESINLQELLSLEEMAEAVSKETIKRFALSFSEKGYELEIFLEHSITKDEKPSEEQYFEDGFESYIVIAIKNNNGFLVEYDEGHLVDNLHIWFVQKHFFRKVGFINRLTKVELLREIEAIVKEDAGLLGIQII